MAHIGLLPLQDTIRADFTTAGNNGELTAPTAVSVTNVQKNGANYATIADVTIAVNQDAVPADVEGFYTLSVDATNATGMDLVDGDFVSILYEATINNKDISRSVSFVVKDFDAIGNLPAIN